VSANTFKINDTYGEDEEDKEKEYDTHDSEEK